VNNPKKIFKSTYSGGRIKKCTQEPKPKIQRNNLKALVKYGRKECIYIQWREGARKYRELRGKLETLNQRKLSRNPQN